MMKQVDPEDQESGAHGAGQGAMTLCFTVMGCGSSGGVPRLGASWGACDPKNPKNQRLRSGFLVSRHRSDPAGQTTGRTDLIIDASPDIRAQLLRNDIGLVDAVLFTHEHADHCHGIDDLRVLAMNGKACGRSVIDVWLPEACRADIMSRFAYCFEGRNGYPSILTEHVVRPGAAFSIEGAGGPIGVLPVLQYHGPIMSMGYRFARPGAASDFRQGGLAFCTDLNGFPDESLALLHNLDVLVLDALRYTPHPCHLSVAEALALIEQLAPKRAILTNLHIDLDYETLKRELPDHIEPAYDGLTIEFDLNSE